MTTDLFMLVLSGVFALVMPLTYATGRLLRPGGTRWALGNRGEPLEVAEWTGRAHRAHLNLIENLPTFAILVLVAHVTGEASEVTALGSMIFFWSRLAHAVVYTAGIIVVRTIVFYVAVAGEALILLELFT